MAEIETVRVTYREIAERFSIGVEGARIKAKRRAAKGLWRIIPGNHPQDVIRVDLPADEWELGRGAPNASNVSPPTAAIQPTDQRRETNDLDALVELLSQMTAQTATMTDRLIEAERAKSEAEKLTAIERSARETAESNLIAVRAEIEEVRERLTREAGAANEQLAAWKDRPWWKRLAG